MVGTLKICSEQLAYCLGITLRTTEINLGTHFPSQYARKRVKNYQSGQHDHVSVLLPVLSTLLLGIARHHFRLAYIWYHNTCLSRNRPS